MPGGEQQEVRNETATPTWGVLINNYHSRHHHSDIADVVALIHHTGIGGRRFGRHGFTEFAGCTRCLGAAPTTNRYLVRY